MIEYIPLYHFFSSLRRHNNFDLGLDEYFSLLEVFQREPEYQTNGQKLLNLCKLLWLKPGHSETLFVALFKKAFEIKEEKYWKSKDESHQENTNKGEEDFRKNLSEEKKELFKQNKISRSEEFLYLNIINKPSGEPVKTTETGLIKAYNIKLENRHQVLSERQVEQEWRSFKRIYQGQISDQLDIEKTVTSALTTGVIYKPYFSRKKSNNATLITLVDNKGSMVAFKNFIETILKPATEGAKIKNSIFYIKNLPVVTEDKTDFYIYKTSAHTTYAKLVENLNNYTFNYGETPILIISDGGAAKGNLNMGRLYASIQLLQTIKLFSSKIVWLNPVPKDRWASTTAHLIKDFIPMFEVSISGLKQAIKILNGKTKANSKFFHKKYEYHHE